MSKKNSIKTVLAVAALVINGFASNGMVEDVSAQQPAVNTPTRGQPNFVVIFCDDLGYADVGCFGSKRNKTPHIDKMAAEGIRFTDFYVTAPVCSPSRSSLLTGCYPLRVDMSRSSRGPYVLLPADNKGLNPSETTIAELLKRQGYSTACIGKWHVGDQPEFMPNSQGFDYYYGIPYSNDMKRKGPRKGQSGNRGLHLPLFRNETIIELSPDQRKLTRNLTAEAVKFIKVNKDKPFFVYLPHVMPHSPHYASEAFSGKSKYGIYSDVIQEIDWSVGEILSTLRELNIDDNTLVIFTSDNGATSRGENHPLSGGKGSILEGGMRVPCVMRWPAAIPAGKTSGELITVMDFLPTFTKLAGGELPKARIDGKDISGLMFGQTGAKTPYEKFFYYRIDQLRAIRSGDWKLHLALDPTLEGWDGVRKGKCDLALYDLRTDIGEKTNVADKHPDVVKRLSAYAVEARKDIGDWQIPGTGQRKAGRVDNPVHPATTTDIKSTDWIGNPDSFLYDLGKKKRVYNPVDYGAVPDGQTLCTVSIQKAIDECAANDGGVVRLSGGKFLSGTIFMKSNITLEIAEGSTLLGSTNLEDYPVNVSAFRSYTEEYTGMSLIYGENLSNIALTGKGTFDGQGKHFNGASKLRPFGIRLIKCVKVTVENITMRNSARWMQHYLACDDVTIRNITVWNHCNKNNDGIDIDGCHNVLIENCKIDSDDDGICFKSTSHRACEGIIVRNCTVSSHGNAIKCGTESNGGFKDIKISHCTIKPSADKSAIHGRVVGLAGIALEIVDGGVMDQVTISDIEIKGTTAPLFVRFSKRIKGSKRSRRYKEDTGVGSMRNVTISDIKASTDSDMGCAIVGMTDNPIENLTLKNISISFPGGGKAEDRNRRLIERPGYPECTMFGERLPAYGLYLWHVKGVTLENIELTARKADKREAMIMENLEGISIDGKAMEEAKAEPMGKIEE